MKQPPTNISKKTFRKPAFSLKVRIGLMSILNRVTPQHVLEEKAIMWAQEYCEFARKSAEHRRRKR